jgi:hypothetical protein
MELNWILLSIITYSRDSPLKSEYENIGKILGTIFAVHCPRPYLGDLHRPRCTYKKRGLTSRPRISWPCTLSVCVMVCVSECVCVCMCTVWCHQINIHKRIYLNSHSTEPFRIQQRHIKVHNICLLYINIFLPVNASLNWLDNVSCLFLSFKSQNPSCKTVPLKRQFYGCLYSLKIRN